MPSEDDYQSVSDLNHYIKAKFDNDSNLNHQVYVTGEISNYHHRTSHQYFSLKDDNSAINAVCFASRFAKVKFDLKNGQKVLVCGTVSTYPKTGQYQLYVDKMEPDGVGQLYQAYNDLKDKLSKAGWFDEAHKKPIPKYPTRVAIVTSNSGAVIRDIVKTTNLRDPGVRLALYPAVVQGDHAAATIIKQLNRIKAAGAYDTVIIARGGGSIEDLWAFNNEELAKTIYEFPLPIISSIGHETDFTIADYVADARAATPTAAAEYAIPVRQELRNRINKDVEQLKHLIDTKIEKQLALLNQLSKRSILADPKRVYQGYENKLNTLTQTLQHTFNTQLQTVNHKYDTLNEKLKALNPSHKIETLNNHLIELDKGLESGMQRYLKHLTETYHNSKQLLNNLDPTAVMHRGYAYATLNGNVIKSIQQLNPNDEITLNLVDGSVTLNVSQLHPKE